jgi:hypothetical protein
VLDVAQMAIFRREGKEGYEPLLLTTNVRTDL